MATPALRVDAQRNVERVLDAAIRVLGDDPAASIEQVAAASGVHRSTVYRRFPTRDVLLRALVAQAAQEGTALVAAAAAREPGESTLRTLCEEMLAFGERYAFLQNHDMGPHFGRDPLGLIKLFRCHQRAGVLRADLSATWLVNAFSALTVTLVARGRNRSGGLDGAATLLAETFLNGSQAGPSTLKPKEFDDNAGN